MDGIYMPHFDPMQVGMEKLRPYMLRMYTGSSITDVKDTFHEIFDSGEFVFLSGHFEVSFDNGSQLKGVGASVRSLVEFFPWAIEWIFWGADSAPSLLKILI